MTISRKSPGVKVKRQSVSPFIGRITGKIDINCKFGGSQVLATTLYTCGSPAKCAAKLQRVNIGNLYRFNGLYGRYLIFATMLSK
jgi:hypothetical protein